MSLINKMLQDLDKRGSAPGEAAQPDIKSVIYEDERSRSRAITAALVVALAVAVGAAWVWLKRAPAPAAAPAAVAARAPQAGVVNPVPLVEQVPPEVVDEPVIEPEPEPGPEPLKRVEAKRAVTTPKADKPVARQSTPLRAEPVRAKTTSVEKPSAKQDAATVAPGRQLTPNQRAEGEYRRGLASLQDGRVTEAMAALEQAIRIDGRHDAARQTLVGLLIEARRKGEAMHVLQTGLVLDPRQPSMAMLLARLQIEGGTSGLETLMRTLPYAKGNAEYHAFLAGALARDDRHREAADQYQAALAALPGNGVWWMGLGLSLQAEKRTAEAVQAFTRAKESTNLTPQLRAFVERKLQALSN